MTQNKTIPKNWKEIEKLSKKPIKEIIDNYEKTIPLSEKDIILDTDTEDKECPECFMSDGVYYKKEDVKEFLRKLKDFIDNRTYIKIGGVRQIVFMDWEWEGFKKKFIGKELCSDDSQTRQSKETSVEKGGGKAERYLFNSDNVSSADTLKLNHKCPICDKDIYLRDDTVNEKGVIYHLGCYLFENHFTINDSLKDIWDNPEDDRWDKEKEKKEND